ncbi:uncharacterized protein [Gossypium hirsutum]|uniref:Uncharacterized protein n=1 Tax=Gossypium hirsutum TaxID=3635 RepID=A0A1U8J2R8_GOSHI|nr:uncharacterized protein LOC107903091 [Gossypium hirsutum]
MDWIKSTKNAETIRKITPKNQTCRFPPPQNDVVLRLGWVPKHCRFSSPIRPSFYFFVHLFPPLEKICRTLSNTLPIPSGGWDSLRRSSSGAPPLNRRPTKRDEGLLKPGSRWAMRSGFDWRRRRALHPIFKPDSDDGERTSVDGATERFR